MTGLRINCNALVIIGWGCCSLSQPYKSHRPNKYISDDSFRRPLPPEQVSECKALDNDNILIEGDKSL
jgi:hypothetical protein